jgi:hypothetical protein
MKGLTSEQDITKKEPQVSVPGYGTMPLDMLKRHVQSLSKEFNDSIQKGEFLKAAYRTEQFYNALMALAKALKQQGVTETSSTGMGGGSAGIGGGAGLGIDKSPMEKVLEKPLGEDKELSVQELATISDEALDKAYGYGRSSPGNTFGWQANLMSAAYAKKMIDSGVTDIEKISDAIHKGWNVTAQKFVQDPEQFSDTEKLRQAGKLDAKLQQRAKLMKINYAELPDDEQEKDRVVARALLQAIKGSKNVVEGFGKPKVLFNPKPMKKGEGNSTDDYEYTDYIPRGKEDKEAWAIKRTVAKQKLPAKKQKELDTGFYKNYLGNRPVREEELEEEQAPMFTPEEKIVNMNDPRSDGWRVYKAKPAKAKESSIMKGIQSEGK